jgi:hypothetical protein
MNAEPKIEQATQEQPKSKRLSSLIWILVMWGFVRLISEMDGISWERAFPSMSMIFGLYPAIFLLLSAVIIDRSPYRDVLRMMALLVVFGSLTSVFFLSGDVAETRQWFTAIQWVIVGCTAVYICGIYWIARKRNK